MLDIKAVAIMDREVFVLPNAESVFVWNVVYGPVTRSEESAPCNVEQPDGKVAKGTIHFSVESADVTLTAFAGSLTVGQQGQLSTGEDKFFDLTISSIEAAEDYVRAFGRAVRKLVDKLES